MAETSVLLGIDVGSSGTKAVLVDPSSGVLATASSDVELWSRHAGWAEADPVQWTGRIGSVV